MVAETRLTISSRRRDPRAAALISDAASLGLHLAQARVSDVVHLRGALDDRDRVVLASLLVDDLLQTATWDVPPTTEGAVVVETALHPGVTDTAATEVVRGAAMLGIHLDAAATGRRFELTGADVDVDVLVRRLLANPVIERWTVGGPIEHPFPHIDEHVAAPELIPFRGADEAALAAINNARSLALDADELRAVQAHFHAHGRDPTDVEVEMLAQTWSEHCAHKTFRARLRTPDGTVTEPLLAQLRRATEDIAAPWVLSAFVGNAGIVSWTPGRSYALKMETHNHPSAVEPFGGANTGVGGVIRDVLGAAHHPIAVIDVLCFGPLDTDPATLHDGVLHPRRIRDGVIAGVADYGNKIGLPTVAGAVLYDPAYTANPLVFCGCIGVAETGDPLPGPQPGDHVVLLGGRTGRDGIRGATFSSMTMDATTGDVAGASVQIGDPIVEKRLMDVLAEATGLFHAITDCGAGGLSSAVGEMAEGVGADVDLDTVPLKYAGLAAWEIWLSEAQERMVLAVPPARLGELAHLADRYGAECTSIGTFTGTGRVVVRHRGAVVVDLDTAFLHDGRPQREMTFAPVETEASATDRCGSDDARRRAFALRRHFPLRAGPGDRGDDRVATLLALLAHPNNASRADVLHRYDHEIRGATIGRPLVGPSLAGPGDGVALIDPGADDGIAIGIGIDLHLGTTDPEAMAWSAVDEAIRNLVAVGADPSRVALMDNFSWGDPRRPETLGALVATVRGCCDASRAYGAPFVSGKDSLNNEYLGADGRRHAVPPTLVVTAVAPVRSCDVRASALTRAGTTLLLVDGRDDPRDCYRRLHDAFTAGLVESCHDVSSGGVATTVAEMCIGGGLGAVLPWNGDLFAESAGRLVCEVTQANVASFISTVGAARVQQLGVVTDAPELVFDDGTRVSLDALRRAFTGGGR